MGKLTPPIKREWGPEGIGGWLLLPAFGLVIGLVLSFVGFHGLALGNYHFPTGSVWGVSLASLEWTVLIGRIAFLLFAAGRFFGKRRNAPIVMIALIAMDAAASGLLASADLKAGADELAIDNGRASLQGLVGAAIWIPYFMQSKRVAATFVH